MPPPTPVQRSSIGSDTYLLFDGACREVIVALQSLGVGGLEDETDEGTELLAEARNLLTYFQTWVARPPASEDRRTAVSRTLAMHARAATYLERRRHEVVG